MATGTPVTGSFEATAGSEGQEVIFVDSLAYAVKYLFSYPDSIYPELCYQFETEPSWIHIAMHDPEAEPYVPNKRVVINWRNTGSTDATVEYVITPHITPDSDPHPSEEFPYTYSPCGMHDPEE